MKKLLFTLSLLTAFSAHSKQPTLIDKLFQSLHPHTTKSTPVKAGSESSEKRFQACPQFFVEGVSPNVPNVQKLVARPLCYDSFAVLHSGISKTPIFVAERLSKEQLVDAKGEKRTDRFFADARLPKLERAELADYKRSGWSRGHMAPAADMPNAQAMAQSFSLANMVPQAPINNQRSWSGIEQATRKYVMRAQGDVYVITGPVYDDKPETIGPGKVWVPKYLYKLVYDASSKRAWAHWIANTDEARASQPISYEELVKRTGIEFFPNSKWPQR